MFVNNIKYEFIDNVNINSGNNLIKLKFPNDKIISCDEMFKDIKEIKNIQFKNFKICISSREMFSGCSSLETLDFSSFNTDEINDMYRMFSGCSELKSLNIPSFNTYKSNNNNFIFCNCINLNINKEFFDKKSFDCCDEENPYFIEEKNICVKECSTTEYKNLILDFNICSKECPENTLIYNSKCFNECPKNTHKKDDENICEDDFEENINKTNTKNDENSYSKDYNIDENTIKEISNENYDEDWNDDMDDDIDDDSSENFIEKKEKKNLIIFICIIVHFLLIIIIFILVLIIKKKYKDEIKTSKLENSSKNIHQNDQFKENDLDLNNQISQENNKYNNIQNTLIQTDQTIKSEENNLNENKKDMNILNE